jgi:multiple antibiotic resistance protein
VTIISAAVLFLLVMDPLANVPFFAAALAHVQPARRGRVVLRELLIAYAVMVAFLFAGPPLLGVLHISEPALTIAGGIILFLIALRMVFPTQERPGQEDVAGEPFVVPLAIPYVAGPSLLAAELLLISREPHRWGEWLVALTVSWAVTAAVVLAGSRPAGYLGRRGFVAVERLMGMVLVAVAVQMFLSGVERFVGQLPQPVEPRASATAGSALATVF